MSNNGRLKVVPAVFTIVQQGDKTLLLRRANTGYADGWYDLPAGHLEDQEELKVGAVRELLEETGLKTEPTDLTLVHVHQNHQNPSTPHYGYIFLAKKWSGTPKILEADKCDDMGWFDVNNLPGKTLPYTKAAIEGLSSGAVSISYHEPNSIDF